MDREALAARLDACELRVRRLSRVAAVTSTGLALVLLVLVTGFAPSGATRKGVTIDSLRVRELLVVDPAGVVRVRIGAPLPDAVYNGRVLHRGDQAGGILMYDGAGRERSGYVTFTQSGLVALTLDTRSRQVALFAADSLDGAVARIWRGAGADWVEMRSDEGGPHLGVGRNNEVAFLAPVPTDTEATAACTELKTEVAAVTPVPTTASVLAGCKAHQTDQACRKCLGLP